MITAVTICSINYLAQAKTLGDSLLKHNPDYRFVIGLVDKMDGRADVSSFSPFEILEVSKIDIENFEEMILKYDIMELNTAVKPFFLNYLFQRDATVDSVVYFDPDIVVFHPFNDMEQKLKSHNIVLTPHFFTPIDDDHLPSENTILNAGVFNLGFIALSRSSETFRFLSWWQARLKDKCFHAVEKGLFVDQIWINLVPVYFDKVCLERHLGYNAAYWNLHERKIKVEDGTYFVNDKYPLIFFSLQRV